MPPSLSWNRRFKGSTFFNFAASNQHTTSTDRRLFGGTALFLSHSASSRISDHGQDFSGLGGWTWTTITGRRGMKTKIINGYRPVRDTSNRPGTVYSQHEKYFGAQGRICDPRRAFLEDLFALIESWIAEGHQIVLGLDLNEHIFSPDIVAWIASLGLLPVFAQHHPNLPMVATCDKGSSPCPINGIWISPSLEVMQCGMTGFGEIDTGHSDHRLLWMDLDEDTLLGYTPPPIPKCPVEFFSIQDPLVVRRYNNYVRRQRNLHRIPSKLSALQFKAQQGLFSLQDAQQYDQLCKLDDGIRRQAKRRSRQFYAGQVLYSDIIGFDYQELRLWHLVLKRRSGYRTNTRHIRRLMVRTGQTTALQLSYEEAKQAQQNCFRRYLKHKKDQNTLREQFERRQDQRIADLKGIPLQAQEKIRKTNRQTRAQFTHIRNVLNQKRKILLHTVEYTNSGNNTVECLHRTEVETACQQEGEKRFSLAAHTPFMQGSLGRDLGFLANQQATDKILNGSYHCGPDVDECSTNEYTSTWSRMRATTASSPFGPLFTDYIAGINNSEVAHVDNLFSSIPVQAGFCPEAWLKAVDVMIPKKQSSLNVDKLRIIVLFHAMFNMINKRVGRQMVQRALDYNQIPIEAFGSVPGRQASICALNKALVNDILRQQRRPAALCSNDATSCYDRIVHVVASICMQRLGVDAKTCRVMFGTLQQLQHYVTTAYGVSASAYGGLQIPLQGVGQGNGAGPAIWLVMSIPLINMLRRQGFGFKSISPISHQSCHLACFTYVDDTDTIHAPLEPNITAAQVNMGLQQAIDTWSGGLYATGGILSPQKSYWYLLDFYWHPPSLSWCYKNTEDLPGNLHFKDPDGTSTAITRHQPSTAVETLGIPLAMDGNQNALVDSLSEKINRWASKIKTRQLTRQETLLSLHTGISKSLDYPLVATRLTKQQCHTLMQPLRQAALPVLGIPSTFPTVLVHSPREFLGLGFPHLWFEQGFAQVGCLLKHTQDLQHDSTAQLYQHALEGLKMELGTPGHPLTYNYYKYHKCTTPTQLHIIWQFCTDLDISLRDGGGIWKLPQDHDTSLMEFFVDNGFSDKELRLLNLCRMHLKLIYISDICTGDGLYLDQTWVNSRTPSEVHLELKWPRSGPPNNHCWALWSRALHQLVQHDDRRAPLRLRRPLGNWLHIPLRWPSFIDTATNRLYRRDPTGTLQLALPNPRRYGTRLSTYHPTQQRTRLPPGAFPTTIIARGTTWTHTGFKTISNPAPANTATWSYTIIRRPETMDNILHGLATGTAIIVTDGSFKDGLGTAAFALRATVQDHDGIDAVNMTPGDRHDLDPYRAELGGIYGCLELVNFLTEKYTIPTGSITLACDCLSVLYRLTKLTPPRPNTPHYDLLMACRRSVQNSPLQWHFKHVRGHQDSRRHYTLLDRPSQLNVDMDSLAKSYWQLLNAQRPPYFSLPAQEREWSIWLHSHRFTNWTRTTAQRLFFNQATRTYWTNRSPTSLANVDWVACGLALRRAQPHNNYGYPDGSPLSSRLATAPDIFLLLPQTFVLVSGARLKWYQSLHNLESWLLLQHTKPVLAEGILSLLRDWYAQRPWRPPVTTNPSDLAVFTAQQQAGTVQVLDGMLVLQWDEAQHQYYLWLNRRTTGQQWLSRLILKLWEIAWDLWRHRHKVMTSSDSFATAQRHLTLDEAILQAYDTFTPEPPAHLARWFSQSLPSLLSESLDFKQQWLEMIDTLTQPT